MLICINCRKFDKKLYSCGGCNLVTYCSVNCQKKDWKNHKNNCQSCKSYEPVLNVANNYFEKKDFYNAVKWFFIAAEKKSYEACYILSNCYIFGYGVKRNMDIARNMEIKGSNIKNCLE